MLTVKETAQRLNVSIATVYALVAANKLRCHRIGIGRGVIRVDPTDIDDFLESTRSEGTVQDAPAPQRPLRHLKLP